MGVTELLAFSVLEEDEGTGGIVFAATKEAAHRLGASEYGDGELDGVVATRAAWADAYAPGPVPKLAMVGNGWHFECSGCDASIDLDEDDERSVPLDPVEVGEAIYCSETCRQSCLREAVERGKVEAEALARLLGDVASRFPNAAVHRTHSYARKAEDGYLPHQVVVQFGFPGSRYAGAQVRIDNGEEQAKYSVANGDFGAWKAWNDAGCPAGMP